MSANVGIKDHTPYTTYPQLVYDYANDWFKIHHDEARPPLKDLKKALSFFKGYIVPLGTISFWHSCYRKYKDVRGDRIQKLTIINELQQQNVRTRRTNT